MGKPKKPQYKLMILGDSSVGKTTILKRFTDVEFGKSNANGKDKNQNNEEFGLRSLLGHQPGMDFANFTMEVDGKSIYLQVVDRGWDDIFMSCSVDSYVRTAGIIIVYDITNQASLNGVPKWSREVDSYLGGDIPMIVLGNKCDLEKERAVFTSTGKEVADDLECQFMEVCATNGQNMKDSSINLMREIITEEKHPKKKRKAKKKKSLDEISFNSVKTLGMKEEEHVNPNYEIGIHLNGRTETKDEKKTRTCSIL